MKRLFRWTHDGLTGAWERSEGMAIVMAVRETRPDLRRSLDADTALHLWQGLALAGWRIERGAQ